MQKFIVILDSGIGGLTILNSILRKFKNQSFIYFHDIANFPYGTKNISNILSILEINIQFLMSQYKISHIILGCNTATFYGLKILKQKFKNITFIGILPPLNWIIKKFNPKTIGCLATINTLNHPKYLKKVKIIQTKNNIKVLNIHSSETINMIEKHFPKQKLIKQSIIEHILPHFYSSKIDILILGCTHFHLIHKQLNQLFKKHLNHFIQIVTPTQFLLKNLKSTLKDPLLENQKHSIIIYSQLADTELLKKTNSILTNKNDLLVKFLKY